jgi:hypothetical protein
MIKSGVLFLAKDNVFDIFLDDQINLSILSENNTRLSTEIRSSTS